MKKSLAVMVIVTAAALGVAFIGNASSGCCLIPQASAATQSASVTTLHIEGMTCSSCATAVKHVLRSVAGVKDAQVSFEKKTGVVTYDPAKVTSAAIAHAVEEKLPAYKATVIK